MRKFATVHRRSLLPALVCAAICWGAGSARAEQPAISQARRALSEGIPQIAIYALQGALSAPGFPANERAAARRLLAEAQLSIGRADEALETLATFTDAGDAEATLLRAHAYAAKGRWAEALPVYHLLNGQAGVSAAAALGEAESLHALGRTEEAVPVLEKWVNTGQAGVATRLRLAALLLEADRTPQAVQILQAVSPVSSIDRNWKRYLEARVFLNRNDRKSALAILDPMLRTSGGPPEGLSSGLFAAATLTYAEVNFTPESPESAIKILETFIRKNPESPQLEAIFHRLDQLYAFDKTPQEGVMQGFVRDLTPRVAALARFYLTRMQIREKRYDRASLSIVQFLGKYPEHPLVPAMHAMRAELELAESNPPRQPRALAAAEAALDAASLAAKSDEMKAEFALRTALLNLWQREFVRAANHLKTARTSPRLRTPAAFDSALAWLMQENHELFEKEFAAMQAEGLSSSLAGQLQLEQGLVKARSKENGAAADLKDYLRAYPGHTRRAEAELALAELAFQGGRAPEAIVHIQAVQAASPSLEIAGQAEYLAIFIEDARQPRDDQRVIDLARAFLTKHPKSSLVSEVRMKLGQVYFHREDYLNAQEQFETLAVNDTDGPYAEAALFLAGQCGTKFFDEEAHKHALELFGKVAARKGPLEPYARLQQAVLKSQLGAEDDAVKIYDSILAATVPPEVRYAALIGKADNLATLARKDPKQSSAAISAYEVLLAIPDAGPTWRNQAAYKKARVLQQMDRKEEALVVYNEILDRNAGPVPRETFWLSRAGFEAAALLEAQEAWRSALGIYKKMALIPGPHTESARQRAKALQMEHFLWD